MDLTNIIEPEKAIDFAKAEVNGDVKEWTLEKDDGVTHYEIEIIDESNNEIDVKLNAQNGEIIEVD